MTEDPPNHQPSDSPSDRTERRVLVVPPSLYTKWLTPATACPDFTVRVIGTGRSAARGRTDR